MAVADGISLGKKNFELEKSLKFEIFDAGCWFVTSMMNQQTRANILKSNKKLKGEC